MLKNNQKEKIHRAGVVPYYIEDNIVHMMFMNPTIHPDKTWMLDKAKFQIAKGRIDDHDASTRDAALREAQEELGLWEGNIVELYEVGVFLGRTTVFAAQVEDRNLFSTPDPYETAETKWMTTAEFLETGRELHRNVVTAVEHHIRLNHGLIGEPVVEEEITDDDPFENPLALDQWGNRVNYSYDHRRRRKR